jgi:hypothetical protein
MHKGKPVRAQTQNGEQNTSLFLSLLNLKSNFPTTNRRIYERVRATFEKNKKRRQRIREEERGTVIQRDPRNKQTSKSIRACVPARGNKSSQSSKEGEGIEEFIPSQFRV